jgi:hypothetical protein
MTAAASSLPADRPRLNRESCFLVSLVALAFLVRVWGLSHMHFSDENVYLQNADFICCGKSNYLELDSRPPLLSLLFAGVFKLWHNDFAADILTALLNALAPLFLYLAGRMFATRAAAANAALLIGFTPFFVGVFPTGFIGDDTGHSLLADSPSVTLIVLAFWLLLRALHRQTGLSFLLAGLALALSVLMRFGSLSTAGILFLLVFAARSPIRAALATLAGIATGIGPYLLWSKLRYGRFLATFLSGWKNFDGLEESFWFFLKDFSILFSWLSILGLALWIARWTWERLHRDTPRLLNPSADATSPALAPWSQNLQLFLWLWAIVVFLFFSSLSHKEPRYAMPVGPPIFLLAGIGLAVLVRRQQAWTRCGGTALLAVLLVAAFWPIHHRFDGNFVSHESSEEMAVSEFLNSNVPASTTLYTNLNVPDFGHYTDLRVIALPEAGPGIYASLTALTEGAVVIAYKQTDFNVAAEPSLAWLDANPHFRRLREFPSLILYEYRREPS